MPELKYKKNKFLQLFVGILITSLLLRNVGTEDLFPLLLTSNFLWIMMAFVPTLVGYYICAVKIYLLLDPSKPKVEFIRFLRAYMLSVSLGTVTPGRIGDFSLVPFLSSEGRSIGEGLTVTLLDKLITFIIINLISLMGIYFYFGFYMILPLFLLYFIIILFFYLLRSDNFSKFVEKYFISFYSEYSNSFHQEFADVINNRRMSIFSNIFLTATRIFCMAIGFLCFFKAFDYQVPLLSIITVNSIFTLSSYIPITFSGLGVVEATGTFFYEKIADIESTLALNVMLLSRVRWVLISLLFYFLNMHFLKYSLYIKGVK